MKKQNPISPAKNSLHGSPQVPPSMGPVEEQMTMLMMQCLQLERTMWLMAQERGGVMVVDEATLNPLWQTKYERVEVEGKPHPTLLKITATQLPDPTDSQIRQLADALAGQPEESTPEALLKVGMSGYPPSFVVARLAPLVTCGNGRWNRV